MGANSKNQFFCSILLQICYFFVFFQLFSTKNTENDYLDQHLGCGAPKRWSKYTTNTYLRENCSYFQSWMYCIVSTTWHLIYLLNGLNPCFGCGCGNTNIRNVCNRLQWGLEFQTRLDFRCLMVFLFSNGIPFWNGPKHDGIHINSLDHLIYKEKLCKYIVGCWARGVWYWVLNSKSQ